MPSRWDEEERRTDEEQSGYFPDLRRTVGSATPTVAAPTPNATYVASWQRWGLPAGLTLGVLIGLIVGYLITFGILLR